MRRSLLIAVVALAVLGSCRHGGDPALSERVAHWLRPAATATP